MAAAAAGMFLVAMMRTLAAFGDLHDYSSPFVNHDFFADYGPQFTGRDIPLLAVTFDRTTGAATTQTIFANTEFAPLRPQVVAASHQDEEARQAAGDRRVLTQWTDSAPLRTNGADSKIQEPRLTPTAGDGGPASTGSANQQVGASGNEGGAGAGTATPSLSVTAAASVVPEGAVNLIDGVLAEPSVAAPADNSDDAASTAPARPSPDTAATTLSGSPQADETGAHALAAPTRSTGSGSFPPNTGSGGDVATTPTPTPSPTPVPDVTSSPTATSAPSSAEAIPTTVAAVPTVVANAGEVV
ncbi:MAG: hypothetical protein HW416_2912, partial [Chloroflexi bacterium]|nr:hypothetical protein [Chloroflexota bacterium]